MQLALSLVSEEKVDQYIVILGLQPIFDSGHGQYFRVQVMDRLNGLQDLEKLLFGARALAPHHVAYLEGNEVDRLEDCLLAVAGSVFGCCLGDRQ